MLEVLTQQAEGLFKSLFGSENYRFGQLPTGLGGLAPAAGHGRRGQMASLMSRILLHLRNSETIRHPRGFAYQVARLRKSNNMWGGGLLGG